MLSWETHISSKITRTYRQRQTDTHIHTRTSSHLTLVWWPDTAVIDFTRLMRQTERSLKDRGIIAFGLHIWHWGNTQRIFSDLTQILTKKQSEQFYLCFLPSTVVLTLSSQPLVLWDGWIVLNAKLTTITVHYSFQPQRRTKCWHYRLS